MIMRTCKADELLRFDAVLLGDGESPIGVPLDVTDLLVSSWRKRVRARNNLHPYLRASGCYVIANRSGDVLYIGRTSQCFLRYLRVKLGVRLDDRCSEIRYSPRYWESKTIVMESRRKDERAAMEAIREGNIRISVVPVYGEDVCEGDKKRAIAALEAKLLVKHERAVFCRPPLNYMGGRHGARTRITSRKISKYVAVR